MKLRVWIPLAMLSLAAALPAKALVTTSGREPIHSSAWKGPAEKVINHPARYRGTIGPIAPIAEFLYTGRGEELNQLLELYEKIPERQSTLYLTTDPGEGNVLVRSSIKGELTVTLRVSNASELKRWRIPKGLRVERLDVLGGSSASKQGELEQAVREFIGRHSAGPVAPDPEFESRSKRLSQ
jgi:hypothetical protein